MIKTSVNYLERMKKIIKIQIIKGGKKSWLTKLLLARTATKNLSLMKVNRLSIRKKDSKMNHRDVRNAEESENNKEIQTETAITETEITADGNKRSKAPFLI